MRSLPAGAAIVCMLLVLAGCADPAGAPPPTPGAAPTGSTLAARPGAAPVKQRDLHLSGRQLNLAVYYLRTWRGRRYLAPEWHPVPYTRAVAAAAVGELLGAEPYCPGSRRAFPDGTRLRGIDIGAGTATVELSATARGALGHATAAEGAPGRGPFSGALTFTPRPRPAPGPWRPSRSAPRTAASSTRSSSRSGCAARRPRRAGARTGAGWTAGSPELGAGLWTAASPNRRSAVDSRIPRIR
jgi:hypothetical protein